MHLSFSLQFLLSSLEHSCIRKILYIFLLHFSLRVQFFPRDVFSSLVLYMSGCCIKGKIVLPLEILCQIESTNHDIFCFVGEGSTWLNFGEIFLFFLFFLVLLLYLFVFMDVLHCSIFFKINKVAWRWLSSCWKILLRPSSKSMLRGLK